MINFIDQYPIHSQEQVGDSYLIRGSSDLRWVYISSEDTSEFEELITVLDDEDQYFAIMEDWMLPYLLEGKELDWQLSCVKLYFPENKRLPEPNPETNIRELGPEHAEYIFNHSKYSDFTSVEYILERINLGRALGIFEDERLVAWLMTHDDGAIGFLHVLPDYRGRGYAQDITYEMIKGLREANQLPFLHIEEDNTPSMNLALKTGFIKDRRIHWFKRN